MTKTLHVGGLVAAGFDPTGAYLLTISHAGRGVYEVGSWERVARDPTVAYPEDGISIGIGPLDGLSIPVQEIDYDTGVMRFTTPDGRSTLWYDSGSLTIVSTDTSS